MDTSFTDRNLDLEHSKLTGDCTLGLDLIRNQMMISLLYDRRRVLQGSTPEHRTEHRTGPRIVEDSMNDAIAQVQKDPADLTSCRSIIISLTSCVSKRAERLTCVQS